MNNTTASTSKKVTIKPGKIHALFSLLEDKDPKVYLAAMSEIIQLRDSNINEALAEYQESAIPEVRLHIHQIESIITSYRKTNIFIEAVKDGSCDAWKGILFIEGLFNKSFKTHDLLRQITELCETTLKPKLKTIDLAEALHKLNFCPPQEELLSPPSFSLYNILRFRSGHNLALAIFARQFARYFDINLHIILYKGRYCLVDDDRNLVDPQKLWAVTQLEENEKVYPCSEKEIIMTFCNALYLSFLVEGHLRPVHKMSQIITALSGTNSHKLPFPLGEKNDQ